MGEFAASLLNTLVESNIADVKSIRDIQLSGTASIRAVVEVTDEATAISIEEAASQGMCVSLDGMAYCTDGTSFELDTSEDGAAANGADSDSPVDQESSSSSSSMSTGAIAGLAVLVVLVAVLIAIVVVKRSRNSHQEASTDRSESQLENGAGNQTSAYMAYLKSMTNGTGSSAGMYERALLEDEHAYEQATDEAPAGADAYNSSPSYDMGNACSAYDQADHENSEEAIVEPDDLTYDPMTTDVNQGDATGGSPPSVHEDDDPAILDQQRALSSSNQGSVRSELYTANVPTIAPTPPPMADSD